MTLAPSPGTSTNTSTGTPAQRLLELQRTAFRRDGIPDAATRIERIDRLEAMLVGYGDRLTEALREDFGTRPTEFSMATEVVGCLAELEYQRKHLGRWMRTTSVNPIAGRFSIAGRLRRDPLGVIGVIGPWNFPVQLTVIPAATAFAAGNRVLVRPSEITAATAAVLAEAATEYFDAEELAVVTDDVATGAEFADLRFDHLFFTGSPRVGALVAAAAGRNLVPHTLELGGKNPVIVHPDADLEQAARRIAMARLVNGGQVCLCPDYVWVPDHLKSRFVSLVLEAWRAMVPRILANPDYTSIVNDANYERVVGLIDDAVNRGATRQDAAPAGERLPDPASRKIAPTVLTGVDPTMDIDGEEIFGPVLSVFGYESLTEPVDFIAARPHPLTLYWFGPDNDDFEWVQSRTRSGSVNANDFALNMLLSDLPFGGVGRSGYGAYHGEHGFNAFTHARAVVVSNLPIALAGLATPPFGRSNRVLNRLQLRQSRRRTRGVTTP